MALVLVVMLVAATGVLEQFGLTERFVAPQAELLVGTYSTPSIVVCGTTKRVTCVVDGDTFWLDGQRVRIADIDTPEIGSPQCSAEAELGRIATRRLAQLLADGPFSLEVADRDEDRYGRKLRVVHRNGASLGNILVAEGLAHSWIGHKQTWC